MGSLPAGLNLDDDVCEASANPHPATMRLRDDEDRDVRYDGCELANRRMIITEQVAACFVYNMQKRYLCLFLLETLPVSFFPSYLRCLY